jgi:CRISPR-associated protein Csm3
MTSKLIKKIIFKGQIIAESGLHIGGSNMSMAIGGADAVVVRNAISNQPYIPGSSLKGKMRSLTEKLFGISTPQDSTVTSGPYQGSINDVGVASHIVCKLYGTVGKNFKNEDGAGLKNIPSRLIVRDAPMSAKSVDELKNSSYTDMPFTEVKTEVVIDRVTSAATPRQLERVPAGTAFEFEMVLNVFEGDDEKRLVDFVYVGLRLVEDDFLGGKGSRGSGQVKIDVKEVLFKDLDSYETDNKPKKYPVSV